MAYLHDGVSSCQSLDGPPAAFGLIVGSVVGLGLDLDLQAVWTRAGRQLPVQSGQSRAGGGGGTWSEFLLDTYQPAEAEADSC